MIFYPNKFERYTASLRLRYMNFIVKRGIKERYLRAIRKIYEFEALFFEEVPLPFDLEKLSNAILIASLFVKRIDFNIDIKSNFILDKKIFSVLLLNICSNSTKISIFEKKNKIIITFNSIADKKINKAVKRLKGYILREVKQNITLCVLNLPSTQKKTEEIETAFNLFRNPLSVIHLYLSC